MNMYISFHLNYGLVEGNPSVLRIKTKMNDETNKSVSGAPKVKTCGMPASEAGRQPEGWENIPNRTLSLFRLFWLLTESNAPTFVGPNTVFGICGALASPWMAVEAAGAVHGAEPLMITLLRVMARLGHVILFNWSNLFIFDLANQRLPESAAEDALNKPWRPVPRGLVTADQIRTCSEPFSNLSVFQQIEICN